MSRLPSYPIVFAFAVVAALALTADAMLGVSNLRRIAEASERVNVTHRVFEKMQAMLSSLQDAETGQRGFLLTGELPYLEPYEMGRSAVERHLAELLVLTRGNEAQQRSVEAMRPLVLAKLEELARTIEIRQSGPEGFAAAREVVLTGEGLRLMNQLRERIAELEVSERILLDERARSSSSAARTAVATTLTGFAASLFLLAAALVTLRRRELEREGAAARLHDEKERFRTTLRSIGDAVVVTDVQGQITLLNPTARELLGWDDDALGRPLEEVFRIVNEDTREVLESPVAKVLRDGQVVGLANHTLLIRRDESTLPIDDSGAPVRDADGRIVGVVLVFRDIRERREVERELARRAERLLEQDRRKDTFLVVLSHELRNPLAPIRNAVTLLQRADPSSAAAQRAREVLDRQVAQLTRLVDDLLDISRITEGKIRLSKEPVSLRDAVRRTVDDHRALFQGREIDVELSDGTDPIWLEADATRLVQIVGNLLQNAAKFTNPGGHVSVKLTTERSGAVLRIRDDGAGMDSDTLAKLFQPFMQAESTLARTQGGLGLGLALARSLMDLHGGNVRASSEGIGKGTEFVLTFPLPRSVDVPRPSALADPVAPLRVLIIEDSEDAAATLREVLELDGHVVSVAHSGPAGVEAALAERPELVLCDVGLPGMDGFEVAKQLRSSGLRARLVALTGYATPEDAARARQAGFDAHMAKPPDMAKLGAILASTPRGTLAPGS